MSNVLLPRMSEKTYGQSESGVFVFVVDSALNKQQVASNVAKTYNVEVIKVNIVNQKGKTKRVYKNRKYTSGKRNDYKKAYVTLKTGDSIPIFAAVEEAEAKVEKAERKAEKKATKKKGKE